MFRDTREELDRLEAELLAQEAEDKLAEELLAEEEDDDPVAYANYANAYGQGPQNYEAYNTDATDEYLDSYSEAVRQPKKSGLTGLLILALVLLAAILGVLAWWAVRFGGLLG